MASSQNLGPVASAVTNTMASGGRTVVTLGSSPATLTNACSTPILVSISVGTVTGIDCSRDGVTFDAAGLLGGQVLLNSGDQVKLTFALAPTVVFWPM